MIGIALLGAGIFAREQHLPAIEATSSMELKAVYSRSEKTVTALANKTKSQVDIFFDKPATNGKSLDDLLARADISAVIICVTIPALPELVQKAIKAGKHVLSEKPIAQNVAAAKALMSWYDSQVNAPMWAVAENFRFNESVRYAESKLRNIGGQLTTFRLNYNGFVQKDNKYFNTEWRKVPEFQGGFLLDSGVHFVASLRLLLGGTGHEIEQLVAYSSQLEKHLLPIDTVHAIVSTKDACNGTICMSFGTEFKSGLEIEIVTTHGAVLWTPVRVKTAQRSDSGEIFDETEDFVYNNAVKTEIEAFSQAIVSGIPDPRQTPLEALKDLIVLQALLESGTGNALVKCV